MNPEPLRIPSEVARRLIVTKQRLAGPSRPRATSETILSVVRDLGYVQWDPVPIVAPSHLLSLWARLEGFRPAQLERLLWTDRTLFEHWTPIASIVRTEDYPLYRSLMERYPDSLTRSWGSQRDRTRRYLRSHAGLRRRILRELSHGPRTLGEFDDHARTRRHDGEWTPTSDVSQMLYHLTMRGEVMVVGHRGAMNLWGLAERFLPEWVDRAALTVEEFELAAAELAILALGVATPREILTYFVRGRYVDLGGALARLERDGQVLRVRVEGPKTAHEDRYVHRSDLRRLDALRSEELEPQVSLLPPFDNMLYSPARGERLFGFTYVREQFLPKAKRRFGLYVLPILRGDSFIGRIDARCERETDTLSVLSVHAEPGAPGGRGVGAEVAAAIDRLAGQLGATSVRYGARVPRVWASAFRRSGPTPPERARGRAVSRPPSRGGPDRSRRPI